MSFAKNIGRNMGKSISNILSSKYNQNPFDNANNYAPMPLKLLQKQFKQTNKQTKDKW